MLELAGAPANEVTTDTPPYRPGQVVGRFELVREIGRGGFGFVYEARDRELGRAVAFKAIRSKGAVDVREERLLREAEAAARLAHPNIVTLYDVGRSGEGPYLVLELLHGKTLSARLDAGPLPVREAVRVAVDVAKGLAHAHAQGIVHRDLTPGNVFLCDDGQVKVLDFGMAHAFGRRKLDGGTRAYMAPEQWRGAPEDERTDVFALGVVLYRMIAGELPFTNRQEIDQPPPTLEIPDEPALAVIVARMLEQDPVKRPRDASEVLAALTSLGPELERAPLTSPVRVRRRASSLEDLVSELRRRRVFRAVLGYGLFAFAVLQIVEPVMHGLGLPEWTLKVVLAALALGFPATVILAWIFDLTSRGIERTAVVAATHRLSRRRLAVALGALAAAAAAPAIAWYVLHHRSAPDPTADLPSIAVLPFDDMSPQHDQEYFADGIAEEILNALAQLDGLRVVGRTSSFYFKGKHARLADIGRELNVSTILEGSVRRDGRRMRISAQLVKAGDGYHLWSHTYDRQLTDVLTVQDEIAHAVAGALQVKLLSQPRAAKSRYRPDHPEAYELYALGRSLTQRSTEADNRRATAALEQAVAIEPRFAPAHVWLAIAAGNLALYTPGAEGAKLARRAVEAADRGVDLDPDLAEGHAVRGWLRTLVWDWSGARADFERAMALKPSDTVTFTSVGLYHFLTGNLQEAVAFTRRALDIDPLHAIAWGNLGHVYLSHGDLNAARAALTRALEIAPDNSYAMLGVGALELLDHHPAAALQAFEGVASEPPRLRGVAIAQHDLGNEVESDRALEALVRDHAATSPYQIALVHAWRGDAKHAFDWLDQAFTTRDMRLRGMKIDPALRNIRGDPRYRAMLERMNLPVD